MKITTFEERRLAQIIRRIGEILKDSGYQNATYLSSDSKAHYYSYESVGLNGDIETLEIQIEFEGKHSINISQKHAEGHSFSKTFRELMEKSNCIFEIVV